MSDALDLMDSKMAVKEDESQTQVEAEPKQEDEVKAAIDNIIEKLRKGGI